MKYDVEVLKKMISVYDRNIEMFSRYKNVEDRLAVMVKERRDLAALVENDGERMEGVTIDTMLYSAQAGADTSWWTKGT